MMISMLLQIENVISGIRDSNLKLMLSFGIGIHHAGLVERDRKTVEELYVNQRIQVQLVSVGMLCYCVMLQAYICSCSLVGCL